MMKRFISILFLIQAFFCQAVFAQSIEDYEARKARLEKEIETIDRQLSDNMSKSRSELSKLTLLQTKVRNRKAIIAASDRQIRQYSDDIYLTQKRINRLQERLDTLSDYYTRLVRSAYKNRDAKVWYMYILASDNLGQAFRRYNYFKNLSSSMKVQADKIRQTQEELELEKTSLRRLKSEAEEAQKKRRAELASLEKEEKQVAGTISTLKRNRAKYEKELASKRRQVQALDKEIKRLIEEAMKASEKKGKDEPQIDYKLAAEFSKNKGKLPWPVSGAVVDRFGQHYHPVFTNIKLPLNNGITIAVAPGTEVRAVFDGVVKQIVVMPGYNQCVLVQHGNYFSFYCKLKTTAVKAGDRIVTGQKIGTVDTINGETQLHFQIWQGTKPQNPETWLRRR